MSKASEKPAKWPQGIGCPNPGCNGVVWAAEVSRLEAGLGIEKGRCEKCAGVFTAKPEKEPLV